VSFVFKIDDAFDIGHGSLMIRGRLRSGAMYGTQLMRLPTTLGVDVVATINFVGRERLGIGWWRELDTVVDVYLLGCWVRPDLICRTHAEFTLFPQNPAVDEWLKRYAHEHGAASVYSA
jgi:hypothetical protein